MNLGLFWQNSIFSTSVFFFWCCRKLNGALLEYLYTNALFRQCKQVCLQEVLVRCVLCCTYNNKLYRVHFHLPKLGIQGVRVKIRVLGLAWLLWPILPNTQPVNKNGQWTVQENALKHNHGYVFRQNSGVNTDTPKHRHTHMALLSFCSKL